MIKLPVLTDKDFQYFDSPNIKCIYSSQLTYKKISYRNLYKDFIFPCYALNLATGISFTVRCTQRLKGLIFNPNEIKEKLSFNLISEYKNSDYLFTPFVNFPISPINEFLCLKQIDINLVLTELEDVSDKDIKKNKFNNNDIIYKTVNLKKKYFSQFLVASILRSKIQYFKDYKIVSSKFNKLNQEHTILKKYMIDFFNEYGLDYSLIEYNSYYYINYLDDELTNLIDILIRKDYNIIKNYLHNDFEYSFLTDLYKYSKNKFYCNSDNFLFLKYLCYKNKLVISIHKNKLDSNKPYFTSMHHDHSLQKFEEPDVIYLDDGYLTRIESIQSVNKKGDADYYPNTMLIC